MSKHIVTPYTKIIWDWDCFKCYYQKLISKFSIIDNIRLMQRERLAVSNYWATRLFIK